MATTAATCTAWQASMLAGRVALVTGSTSGIGLGIAHRLASAGASVMLNGFGSAREIEETRTKLSEEHGVEVMFNGADLSKREEVHNLVADTVSRLGSVDILVNNAGIQHVSPTADFPPDMWDKVIAINLTAPFDTIQAALPHMVKGTPWGRIVNIASVHGLVASANKAPYVASKHGLIGLTKTVALEHAGSGITANCVCPGWVHTPLVQKQIEMKAQQLGIDEDEAKRQLVLEKQPSLQMAQASDIGDMVTFLCSPAAAQVTGASMTVDGGWTAQ